MAVLLGDSYYTFAANSPHLWVVISDPEVNCEQVALVNLTDRRHNKDGTCILSVGDHPFITKETDLFYGRSKFMQREIIDGARQAGHMIQKERFSISILHIIQQGALQSPFTPREIKRLLEAQRIHLGF